MLQSQVLHERLGLTCRICRLQVQLTMVLYDQREYNRARRWRLPKCTLSPGEYQARISETPLPNN